MKLYHGSNVEIPILKRRQAGSSGNIDVPKKELLNAIYLTPDYGFALACATRPEGMTEIDGEAKRITFEEPELFDPEMNVYVYEVDSEDIPREKIIEVDDHQFAVDSEQLKFSAVHRHKARDVQQYYELTNWKEKIAEAGQLLKVK